VNQLAIEEQIARLQKELSIGGTETEERLLDLRAEVDRIHLELAAIKKFLGTVFPVFEEQYPQILSRTIEEVNPEFD
jgi:hypothetical protein